MMYILCDFGRARKWKMQIFENYDLGPFFGGLRQAVEIMCV